MKNYLLITFILLLVGCKDYMKQRVQNANKIENKEIIIYDNEFEKTVYKVVKWYNEKNQDSLNSLINKETGLYLMFRKGTYDEKRNVKKICFDLNCIYERNIPDWLDQNIKEQNIYEFYKISYSKYPTFDTEDCEIASKGGLFIDTLKIDRFLSETTKKYRKIFSEQDGGYSDEQYSNLMGTEIKLENSSRKIILTKHNNGFYSGNFIFYLSKINSKWYLTIIDFASGDCSA